MKPFFCILPLFLLATVPIMAQQEDDDVKIITDEKCGCDLVFINGIETTKSDGRYGFRLEDGTQIVPNKYMHVDRFKGGYCRVLMDLNQWGLIDSTGREVVPCIYHSLEQPSEGRVLVYKDERYGYTDMEGNEVIPLQYIAAGSFSEGCAPVGVIVDSLFVYYTYIDTLGRQLFPPVYEYAQPFHDGFAPVQRYQRWGLIDHSGREVLPTVYEQMTSSFDTLFFAGDQSGMALFDKRMKPLTDFVYTWSGGISEGRLPVQRADLYGFLDRSGREVIPCEYDRVGYFDLGRAMVSYNERYGIIDTAGRFVLPMEYEYSSLKRDAYIYRDSLALVERNGRFAYVNLDGNLVIDYYFDDAFEFADGLAAVRLNGRWGYIDTHGDIFLPFIFDLTTPFKHGRAEVIYNGEVRKVDRRGRCVKNCKGIVAWRDWTE